MTKGRGCSQSSMQSIRDMWMLLSLLLWLMVANHTAVSHYQENNIFAAIEHMKPLVDLEKAVVNNARIYLNEQRKRLDDLKPLKKAVEDAQEVSDHVDQNLYLGNPIDSFKLIDRFMRGWKDLDSLKEVATSEDEGETGTIRQWLDTYYMYTPTDKDIVGAMFAFIRLQDNYNITARSFVDGKIDEMIDSRLQLTASDCMAIADWAHSAQRYVRMKEWLLEAERLITDASVPHRHGNTTLQFVNEYLAWSYYLEGDLENALKYTELVLEGDSTSDFHVRNREVYLYYKRHNLKMSYEQTTYMAAAQGMLDLSAKTAYVKACMGINMEPRGYDNIWNLRCFYKQDHPLLYLKPQKVSQMHDNPEVYLFHDILSDATMEKLKKAATHRLDVSKVVSMQSDNLVEANYRVSKNMYFHAQHPADQALLAPLKPMFESITGLNVDHGEQLQMNNYGLGGQYEFHHDYGQPGTMVANDPNGNRLATVLLYLSDVERGGHTVFTEIGLSLPPLKGSGVFWYNLHRNGTGFHNTRHASCPVVSGSKWVANKWVRMRGNEFNRPCSLNQFE